MRRIVVTGGAGFTGVNLARHFLQKGDEVIVFDNFARAGTLENLGWLRTEDGAGKLKVIPGDLRLPSDALRAQIDEADAVYHLAAQVAVTTSVRNPREDFEINAAGTFNMLELVREAKGDPPPFFYASTNKVYGGMEDVATVEGESRYSYRDLPHGVPEERPLDFHSPYGCSKGAADQYVRDYARIYGIPTVVFRQSCIYGYRQFGVEDQGWVAWFIIAAVLGKDLTIFGDGKQVRDVLFIDDLVALYESALERIDDVAGRVYNVGGGPGNAISLHDLLGHLGKALGRDVPVSYSDWRPGDQPVYVSDIRRLERELGWTPQIGWEAGVDRLIGWVQENQDMLAKI